MSDLARRAVITRGGGGANVRIYTNSGERVIQFDKVGKSVSGKALLDRAMKREDLRPAYDLSYTVEGPARPRFTTGLGRIKPGMPGYNIYDDEGEFEVRHRTDAEARDFLAKRYDEQSAKYPHGFRNIDKAGYIRTNLKYARRYSVKVGSGRRKAVGMLRTADRAARRAGRR